MQTQQMVERRRQMLELRNSMPTAYPSRPNSAAFESRPLPNHAGKAQMTVESSVPSGDFMTRLGNAERRDSRRAGTSREALEQDHLAYQMRNRESWRVVHKQPVGGRMQRQFKIQSAREANSWTAREEAAYRKAFKKPSRGWEDVPTGI